MLIFSCDLRGSIRRTKCSYVSAFAQSPNRPGRSGRRFRRRNLWILNSWRDLILYVGTPLLLVPLFALAQTRWSAQDIYVFVAAFGATGHHLPGMIRAYGDRALFERFRWRFIFAPIFLLAVCTAFTLWDLKGIVLVVFFWGVWHGMMQTYGFCRIYDAKMGSFAALTRRLDFATCAIWFAAAVFLSSRRMTDTLEAVLRQWSTLHSAMALARRAADDLVCGDCSVNPVRSQFCPNVVGTESDPIRSSWRSLQRARRRTIDARLAAGGAQHRPRSCS